MATAKKARTTRTPAERLVITKERESKRLAAEQPLRKVEEGLSKAPVRQQPVGFHWRKC